MSISVSVSLSKLPFPHSITLIHFTSDYSEVFHVLCVKSQQTLYCEVVGLGGRGGP